jgi:hypothetical protein
MNSTDPDYDLLTDYEVFTRSNEMKTLVDTNDLRREEEMSRPRVEIWPDEWSAWVASHETCRRSLICSLPAMKASPFCSLGYH